MSSGQLLPSFPRLISISVGHFGPGSPVLVHLRPLHVVGVVSGVGGVVVVDHDGLGGLVERGAGGREAALVVGAGHVKVGPGVRHTHFLDALLNASELEQIVL